MSEYHNPWLQLVNPRPARSTRRVKQVSLHPRQSQIVIWNAEQSREFREQQAKKAKKPI